MNPIKVYEDKIILRGDWAGEVLLQVDYSGTENREMFHDLFEVVDSEALGDPDEAFYQGVNFTSVIRRKSDGAMFGFDYWKPISKYEEWDIEPNGDDDEWILYPVLPFTITGYKVVTP